MANFLKNKVVTGIVVATTIILAGVAVFTALRLYQLRTSISPTSPESKPSAWDCNNYKFAIDFTGTVTANNQSNRNEPSQQAKVLINGSLSATFNVPALNQGQNATIGSVTLPSGTVHWEVQGTLDCRSSGQLIAPKSCQALSFTLGTLPSITVTPIATLTPTDIPTATLTPTSIPESTATPTPTEEGRGGGEETPTPNPSNTPTPTNVPTSTPTERPLGGISSTPTTGIAQTTPTTGQIAQISPSGGVGGTGNEQLPQAGVSLPTIAGLALGILLIIGAFMLAL